LSTPLAAHAPGASRALGFWMCTALVVGNIIGIGIFLIPAQLAPFGLNALTGWLVTVLGCVCLALAFALLARRFADDDGPYDYVLRTFGPATAFLVMWCYWVSVWVANAGIAMGVVAYLLYFLPALNSHPLAPPVLGLAMLWLFVLINSRGVRAAGWVQVLTTVLKLVPQIAVILLGLLLLFSHPRAYTQHLPPNPASWREVASVSAIALFAMLGIECATIPAGRVRDPERTIPRATLAGTLIAAGIYVGISVVPMLLIPQRELTASSAPFADLFARLLGGNWGGVCAAFVLVSGLGALNGWTLIIGEVTETVARHGGFPRWLAQENRHGAPARAFVATGVVSSLMLLGNYAGSITELFGFLTAIAVNLSLPLYFLAAAAIVRLKWLPGTPAVSALMLAAALIAAAYCGWVAIGLEVRPLVWGAVLGLAGIPVYLACTRTQAAGAARAGLP